MGLSGGVLHLYGGGIAGIAVALVVDVLAAAVDYHGHETGRLPVGALEHGHEHHLAVGAEAERVEDEGGAEHDVAVHGAARGTLAQHAAGLLLGLQGHGDEGGDGAGTHY